MPRDSRHRRLDRRSVLTGLAGIGATGLAGCSSSGDGSGDGSGGDGSGDGGDGSDGADGGGTDGSTETGSTETTSSAGEITVGVGVPLTGDLGFFGKNIEPAVKYVVKQINDDGGIGGRTLSTTVSDTKLDADTAVSIAQRMINVENVQGIIGFTASTLFKILDMVQENGVPYFAATSSGDLVPIGGKNVFMVFPSDLLAGSALGLAANNQQYNGEQSYGRMGTLVAQEGLYSSFMETLRKTYTNEGGQITQTVQFQGGKSSYQAEAQRVVGSDPEIITVLAGPTDVVKLIRAGFNAGYQGQWLGTEDISTQEFLDQAPAQLTDGMLGVISTSPEYVDQSFKDDLAGKFMQFREREYGIGAWLAYDAMTVMGLAMKKAAVDGDPVTRETISANIPSIGNPPGTTVRSYPEGAAALENGDGVDFQGVRSNCDFDEQGNVSTPYNVTQVQDGSWEVVSQIPAGELSTGQE